MNIAVTYLRWIVVVKMLSTVVPVTYCCSSRFFKYHKTDRHSTANQYPYSTTVSSASSHRKNSSLKHRTMSEKDSKLINSIIHAKCSKDFDQMYCLHGGRCFNYTVANYSHPSCECQEGFMGERCEVKYYSMYYPLQKTKIRIAGVCFSAAAASIFSVFFLYYCQTRSLSFFMKNSSEDASVIVKRI